MELNQLSRFLGRHLVLRHVKVLVVVLLLVHAFPAVQAADEKTEKNLVEVKNWDQSEKVGKSDVPGYFLWWTKEEGWHIRTDSNDEHHTFAGVIDVIGGKFTGVSEFGRLETSVKKSDVGHMTERKITFRFSTKKKLDGFNFQVSKSAKRLRLKLLIDGETRPAMTWIGADAESAPAAVFLLPAHPTE